MGAWNNPDHWSTLAVPGANETATFNATNSNKCTVNGDVTVGTLELNGYAGTITINPTRTLTVATLFTQNNGTITGAGSLSLTTANGFWTGGTLGGTGNPETSTLVIGQNRTFAIKNDVFLAGRVIQNSGTIEWNDNQGSTNSTIETSNGGAIHNLASGIVTAPGLAGVSSLTGQGAFFNSGLVVCQGGAVIGFSVPVTSYQGTFAAEGNINFVTSLTLMGGAPSAGQNANFTGAGLITVGGSCAVNGAISTEITDLRFFAGPAINAGFTILDGTVRLYSPTTITGSVDIAGGVFRCMASVLVSGANARIDVPVNGGRLLIRNGLIVEGGSVSNSSANLRWEGGNIELQNDGLLSNYGTLRILEPDEMDPAEPLPLPIGTMSGDGSFANIGTMRVFTMATIDVSFENHSRLFLQAGVLIFNQDWTQGATGFLHLAGGELHVSGDLTNYGTIVVAASTQITLDTLVNHGTIDMAGGGVQLTLAMNFFGGGHFVQSASGTLIMSITGNNDASDKLVADGIATLDGTLLVKLPEGVNVNPNQVWTLLSAATVVQQFATVQQPPGFGLPTYNLQSVTIGN